MQQLYFLIYGFTWTQVIHLSFLIVKESKKHSYILIYQFVINTLFDYMIIILLLFFFYHCPSASSKIVMS